MMTQQLGFSILSAPLAAIDRRALSQAWYSALHEARSAAPQPFQRAAAAPQTATPALKLPAAHSTEGARSTSTHVRKAKAPQPRTPAVLRAPEERRAARSPLARSIERTFLHPGAPPKRATFVVDGAARVHVTLQTEGTRVRLVAVCAPVVRAAVARALEQARFALSARGIDVAMAVR